MGALRRVNGHEQLALLQATGGTPLEVPEQGKDLTQEWLTKSEGGKLSVMKSGTSNSGYSW